MIAHLGGREAALEAFGWTGAKAEWIALACLHSGVFTRAQCAAFLDAHPEQVRRVVHALIAQRFAVEETVPGVRGIGRVCRVHSRKIYRALEAEHVRHRRSASTGVLMRRLLSLDHVIERLNSPWLATEGEKVAAFEALGIERELLPSRLYRGAAGTTRRFFPVKLPVALGPERAVFVYADSGHRTAAALRSWGAAHRELWRALRSRGRAVEVVVAVRTLQETERADRVTGRWVGAQSSDGPVDSAVDELARIERAIVEGAVDVLDEFGGLQAAMKRSVELEKRVRQGGRQGSVDRAVTWRTERLAGARYR